MSHADAQAYADRFLKAAVLRLKSLTFFEFSAWPDYPGISSFELRTPANLSQFTFTLMKDTLPNGEIRIVLQRRRHPLTGTYNTVVDGFAVAPNGTSRALREQEVWYLS